MQKGDKIGKIGQGESSETVDIKTRENKPYLITINFKRLI